MLDLKACLQEAVRKEASDFHVVVGMPPVLRINGELVNLRAQSITSMEARDMLYSLLSPDQKETFEKQWDLNFALSMPGVGRFRVNMYMARSNVEAAFRVVSVRRRSIRELGLPEVVAELSRRSNGLVLVTGAAGQGKSTTLTAMIDFINHGDRRCRIITIEDPIEYLHQNINSVVIQREVGIDAKSFSSALTQSLRQDPNVLCIGEMRDLETIATALTAAETGHLVLATLHTQDAPQSVDRIVDVFPSHQQQQIRYQLAACLEGVIAQKLVPKADGEGRVLAPEILIATPAVRNLIRTGKTEQLYSVIQTGAGVGMVSGDQSLKELYQKGVITQETALGRATDPDSILKQSSTVIRFPLAGAPRT